MTWPFVLLALIILAGAVAAMSLRNLVHCALALVVSLAGLAGLYLQLQAQFVGLAQVLIYIGAVAILIVFAILLTRSGEVSGRIASGSMWIGLGIAVAVALSLGSGLLNARFPASDTGQFTAQQTSPGPLHTVEARKTTPAGAGTVQGLGAKLMADYVLPLEVVGLLLTAALIGAVLIAMPEKRR
jgi:NADH-quinone oxidoreductase subunit J